MEKLLLIQSELKAHKKQFNAFGKYNYRNCEDILEAVKPLLLKYKCTLLISDQTKELNGILLIEARALFIDIETKDKVEVYAQAGIDTNRKGMDLSQSFGASSSYARKYALNGLFLIDDTKDADATNTHGKEEVKDQKPALTSDMLKKAIVSIQQGKKETVLKHLENFTVSPEQQAAINLTIKNV